VLVPDRPSKARGNTRGRPAYVWLSDENFGTDTACESSTSPIR
jgi:hypothetical protein